MASAIIVFSHLRWDFVFQRPQQLLSRLAAHHPVVFVEEPVHHEGEAFFKTCSPVRNVLVCQPHTPANMAGFHDDHLPHLQKLLRQLVRDYDDHIAWFTTPMALPLLQELHPRLVVYDCMDEPAAAGPAPKQLPQRESALLKAADLVLTGGPGMYRARRERHPNVHCLPCSVDAGHFVPALDRANSHPAHKDIPGPRLGFYGVIDERIDAELIGKVADAHPQWQVVLAGPVTVDPAGLPQRPNIHYLGRHPYEALPQLLAGWDVCLLPFALNESTRFINPVETLEYMAAELPIVSTPVADVAETCGGVVSIAGDARAFIAACEAALLAPPEEHEARIVKMRKMLASMSWDATVEALRSLLQTTPRRQPENGYAIDFGAENVPNINRLRTHEALRFIRTGIIGAGPAGLSAAYHLGHDAVLLEKNPMVGGRCRSIKDNGFTFDLAGRTMLSGDPYVLEMVELLLGSNIRWQDCVTSIYGKTGYACYSLQDALHGLPPEVIEECAAFGMETRCGYPLRGGLQALVSGFVPHIKGTIELNAEVARISPKQRIMTMCDGRRYQYDNLISTIPLPELARMTGDEAPEEVRRAAMALRHIPVRCVNLGVNFNVECENAAGRHWIYYPEGMVFQRIFVQGNASPENNPPGGFGITCEIIGSPPVSGQELIDRCIRDCVKAGLFREGDRVIAANEIDIPYAYVAHDHEHAKNVDTIRSWLSMHDIILAGRCSEWESHEHDHDFIAGMKAAEAVRWMEKMRAVAVE
ncbi:glycosyltransferase [Herbaspirillum sp. HC18]|nr:glycosyltransferase [Herbaspirillum sp. HC18]